MLFRSEELGFAGVLLLVGLFGIMAWRLVIIARKANSDFGQLLALGILITLVGQAIIHMGMNMGLFPVTGISLPFISSGGSYLISAMMMIGLAQSVAVYSS